MIPVLITVTMLAAAAAAMLLAIRLPADVEADSKVDLIVFENELGERIEYTRDEALEAMAQFKARRDRLVENLEKRNTGPTPAQEKRWAHSYQEAVVLTRAIDQLAESL